MKYLIVSGGYASDEFVSETIRRGGFEVVMAADSGLDFLYRTGIMPDVIVGDFDSVKSDALDYFREFEHIEMCMLNPEKDDTDTEFAIREAIRRGASKITIVGGTGTRIDHVLGNICLLGIGLEENVKIVLLDEHNRIRMIDKPLVLKKEEQYGKYISLVPYSDRVTGVTLTGLKYPLTDYTMGGFNSLGISNEIVDEEATISLTSGQLLVIESRD
ncbi:MAG: thiamine diphosphokinase [Lachnospiraceae bacterium]|nr:thiamine diphosphokinase [Agathobacter sp.]MDD6290814.1 thiamine diphosphokinase [Lachnospiraceae bacterium]